MQPRGCSRTHLFRLVASAAQETCPVLDRIDDGNGSVVSTGAFSHRAEITSTVTTQFVSRGDLPEVELDNPDSHEPVTTGDSLLSASAFLQSTDAAGSDELPEDQNGDLMSPQNIMDVSTGAEMIKLDTAEAVRRIAVIAKLSMTAIAIMLQELRPLHPELCRDPRTLMGTPRVCDRKKTVPGGEYIHFGLRESITQALRSLSIPHGQRELRIQLNIDGMSPFRKSGLHVWPILCRVLSPSTPVFVVGAFAGYSKPQNTEQYLIDIVQDLSEAI